MKTLLFKVITFSILIPLSVIVVMWLGLSGGNTAQAAPQPIVPTLTLPGVTITLPPITLPPVRITIRVPGPTTTIRLPGPTETATVRIPGPPAATATKTVTINSQGPTATSTQTIGHNSTTRATVIPSPVVRNHTHVETHTKTDTIVHRVFIGTLVAIGLLILAILAGIGGYYFGYKDSDKKEIGFLQSLMERVRGERN